MINCFLPDRVKASDMRCDVALTFESVDEILNCIHPNESYWAVLSCEIVYSAVQGGCNF